MMCFHGIPKSACGMCLAEEKLREIGQSDLAAKLRKAYIESESSYAEGVALEDMLTAPLTPEEIAEDSAGWNNSANPFEEL